VRQVAREVRYVVAAILKWRASGEGSKVLDDDDNRHQSECLAPRTIAKRKKTANLEAWEAVICK